MSTLSRRSFLLTAMAAPFLRPFTRFPVGTRQPAQKIRYDARSPQGRLMLRSYALGVSRMMTLPASDPRSWTFQWYTHAIPGAKGSQAAAVKLAALNAAYPPADPARQLAVEMWNTCESHSPWGQQEDYFLPWHRMYVYYFEIIVREMSGDPNFTLPYWDYSAVSNSNIRGILPPEFLQANDPTFKVLYRRNRNDWVNSGNTMRVQFGLDALAECEYSRRGLDPGFNESVDQLPHGMVHVGVGTRDNMGDVPTAAGDPIFWLHHSNIDRIWASWQAAPRVTPQIDRKFVFAGAQGARVERTTKDFLQTAPLDYGYDRLETVPPDDCRTVPPQAVPQAVPLYRRTTPVTLGTSPTVVPLSPPPGAVAPRPLSAVVRSLTRGSRLFLIASALRTNEQPGVTYRVYLDLPNQASAREAARHLAGSLHFFDAGVAENDTGPTNKSFTFDITSLAKKLGASRALHDHPTITIVPNGTPISRARPAVGEISIVRQ